MVLHFPVLRFQSTDTRTLTETTIRQDIHVGIAYITFTSSLQCWWCGRNYTLSAIGQKRAS